MHITRSYEGNTDAGDVCGELNGKWSTEPRVTPGHTEDDVAVRLHTAPDEAEGVVGRQHPLHVVYEQTHRPEVRRRRSVTRLVIKRSSISRVQKSGSYLDILTHKFSSFHNYLDMLELPRHESCLDMHLFLRQSVTIPSGVSDNIAGEPRGRRQLITFMAALGGKRPVQLGL